MSRPDPERVARWVAKSRTDQGLPRHVENEELLRRIARKLKPREAVVPAKRSA
jgi:hypothetical protein